MLQAFSAYIKDIAIFLIFMSFIDMIVPQKKYKEYINLVTALILIFIVINPINSLINYINKNNNDYIDLFSDASINYNKSLMQKEGAYYEETQKNIILAQYSDELSLQLKRLVESGGQFTYINSEFSLNNSVESFGEILSISVTVEELTSKPTKKPFIRVEPVKVKVVNQTEQDENLSNVESSHIKELKKSISDFYQILDEHIYVYMTE